MKLTNPSKNVVRWLEISDIHLGNIRTTTEFILDNLERELFSGVISTLDLLIIAGDLFDRLLEYNHPSGGRILLFVDRLMIECSTHNVKLRVLEGTPSHDNLQNKIFDDLYATGNYTCDMKYVYTLSIEYIQDWDIRVLYVPDKIRTTVEEVYTDTLQLLKDNGLVQVDFCVMHGAFSHQLPPMAKQVYIGDDWLKIVKHWILVGHVHFHSIYQRIAAAGSFDRLVHGEEGPKGYLMGTMNFHGNPKDDEIYFIENKGAKKYVTIDCFDDESMEDLLIKIKSIVEPLPNESYIRIRANRGNPIFSNMAEVAKINLSNIWSKDDKILEDESVISDDEVEEILDTWVPVHIDRNNIHDVIMDRLSAKAISGNILKLASNIINEAK